ncbi:MAG: class I SAM-dependent methyltransferase [Chloroflexi bacterium HGW-Chloroflexi-6]|nr:MAG: class I SAM-dependent methyltransferase [Chloroflexi bacterium HGW-Chloroflexi-6]
MFLWAGFRDMTHNWLFSRKTFEFFQKVRINLTKNYHYSPIPDMRNLQDRKIWEQETTLPGVELREIDQLQEVDLIVPRYRNECSFPLDPTSTPHEYYMRNDTYGWLCATLYHCMIRYYKPRKIIELGAGRSTCVAARAVCLNSADGVNTELIAVDPFPSSILQKGFPGLSQVLPKKVEDLSVEFLTDLQDGDILFIDSTHTVKLGGDVTYLFLEILPRLKPGVLVHIHDIFWPRHYPAKFLLEKHYFWAEQYLLQSFLAFNNEYQILWTGSYLAEKYPNRLKDIFPLPGGISEEEAIKNYGLHYDSNSFWMRRVKG